MTSTKPVTVSFSTRKPVVRSVSEESPVGIAAGFDKNALLAPGQDMGVGSLGMSWSC